jgi:hypothetical protein
MKKIFSAFMAAALLFSIAGCAENRDPENSEQSDGAVQTEQTSEADNPAETDETQEVDNPQEPQKPTDDQAKEIIQTFFELEADFSSGLLMERLGLKEHNENGYNTSGGQGGFDRFAYHKRWVERAPGQYGFGPIQEKFGAMYLYDDYKQAMLKYVTEDVFEKRFTDIMLVREDGFIDGVGGGTGALGRVDDLIFIGENDGVYRYEIKLAYLNRYYPIAPIYQWFVELMFDGGNYVVCYVDDIYETHKVSVDIGVFFPWYIINAKERVILGFEKGMEVKDFDLTEMYVRKEVFPPEFFRIEFIKNGEVVTEGYIEDGMTLKTYCQDEDYVNEYKIIING